MSSSTLTQAEIDEVEELYQRARKAFKEVEFWPQEKVDEMVAAVGWEWQKEETAKALAKLAVEESGIGVYEDKVAKIKSKTLGTLWDQKGAITCGLVKEDKEQGLRIYAKPMGVVANVAQCRPLISLDQSLFGDDATLADTLADPEQIDPELGYVRGELEREMVDALDLLSARERDIVARYYGLGHEEASSLEAIGQDIDLSRERVRQIRNQALSKIRQAVNGDILVDYLN